MIKLLKDIIYKTGIEDVSGNTNIAIEKITFDSREVEPFSLFVAVKGTQVDGHVYINKAIEKGAIAIVCEELPENLNPKVTYIKVKDSSYALGIIASNYYGNPSNKIKLVGVTGTNGKTTTATLLHELFTKLGYKCGLISTVNNKIGIIKLPATHTTPDAIQLNALINQMVEDGCQYCFMEVSSHAVHQNRISGLDFDVAIFTNLTHDHLDYHGTFDEYIKAKKNFFDQLKENSIAYVNKDDRHWEVMVQNTKAVVKTYALKTLADFHAKIIESHFNGMLLHIGPDELWTKLIGKFNVYNLLAVYGTAILLNQEKISVLTAISSLGSVEGRFQYIQSAHKVSGIVDYAHTPDALKNVLETINEIRTGNEQLITVVGCGGDRDKAKRPVMAKIACENSDKVILTSDNPRTEDPEQIIEDMKEGVDPVNFKKVLAITNREEAIKVACSMADPGDIVLIAGKGHEKYQEINGVRHPFDDMQIVKQMFELLNK